MRRSRRLAMADSSATHGRGLQAIVGQVTLLWAWQVLDWAVAGTLLGAWLFLGAVRALVSLVWVLGIDDDELASWVVSPAQAWARLAGAAGHLVLMGTLFASGHYAMGAACVCTALASTGIYALLAVARKRVSQGVA